MPRIARLATLTLPVLTALLTACGGGSGASDGEAAQGSGAGSFNMANSGSPPVSAPAVEPACGSAEFKAQALARVNALRAQARQCGTRGAFAAAPALRWNGRLEAAAQGHAQDMMSNDFHSHTSSDGRDLRQRVEAQGYAWSRLAENIAAGQTTLAQVMQGWIDSEGHCANIMQPELVEIGVACADGSAASTWPRYWTMDLGTPR
jgi:uncharacterized protein YkwD